MALSRLLHAAPQPEPGALDWMDWEHRKTLRLLLHDQEKQQWQPQPLSPRAGT
jgi:hypothetical protein